MNEVQHRLARARGHQRRVLRTTAAIVVFIALIGTVAGAILHFGEELGPVRVNVAPGEAAATATIEIVEGRGVVWSARVLALPGPLALQIGAPGFLPETVAVERPARARGGVDVELREQPAVLRATTAPDHPETRWSLDGAPVGTGSSLELEVPAGDYVVSASYPGYVPASLPLRAERGGAHAVTLPLARVEGRIAVTSQPDGAEVMHNGRSAGTTPLDLTVLGGPHTLRVAYPGHEARTETLAITHDAPEAKRHYRLEPAPARVSFALSPAGGTLTLDGRDVTGDLQLAPGVTYRIRYAKPGYAPQETELTPKPGDRRVVAITLDPVHGVVSVRSEPEADIEIDGRHVGRTPKRLRLQAVPQTIRLSRDGYRAETRTVTPDPDTAQQVEVTLRTEAEARLATAPTELTNSAGIVLRLFKNPARSPWGHPAERPAGGPTSSSARSGSPGRSTPEFTKSPSASSGSSRIRGAPVRRPPPRHRCRLGGCRPLLQLAERARGPGPGVPVRERPARGQQRRGGRLPASDRGGVGVARPQGRARPRDPVPVGRRDPRAGAQRQPRRRIRPRAGAGVHPALRRRVRGACGDRPFRGQCRGAPRSRRQRERVGARRLRRAAPETGGVETDPMDTGTGRWHAVKGSSWRSGTLSELRAACAPGATVRGTISAFASPGTSWKDPERPSRARVALAAAYIGVRLRGPVTARGRAGRRRRWTSHSDTGRRSASDYATLIRIADW